MSVEVAQVSDGYALSNRVRHVPGVDAATAPVGRLQAVSASTGKTLWTYQQRAPVHMMEVGRQRQTGCRSRRSRTASLGFLNTLQW